MTLEEFRKSRQERLQNLKEGIMDSMPYPDGKTAHIEVDAVLGQAMIDSKERENKVKEAFKDKDKEVEEFLNEQDKATGAKKEDKSINRYMTKLHLDESLFEAVNPDRDPRKEKNVLYELDQESLDEDLNNVDVIYAKDGDIESALEQIPDSFWSVN